MTAMRFLALVVITFAVVQIAAAEDKKTTTTKKTIEVNDYGFGVSMPVTTSSAKKNGSGSSPLQNASKSGSKH